MERLADQAIIPTPDGRRLERLKDSTTGAIDSVGNRVGKLVDKGENLHGVLEEYRTAISSLESTSKLKAYRENLEALDGEDMTHSQRMSIIMSLGDVGKGFVADEVSSAASDVLRMLPQKKVAKIGKAGIIGVYGVTQIAKGAANVREAARIAMGRDKTVKNGESLALKASEDLEQERNITRDAVLSFFNSGNTLGKKGMPGVRRVRFVHAGIVAIGSDIRDAVRAQEEDTDELLQLSS